VNAATGRKAETKVMGWSVLLQELDKLSKLRDELNVTSVELDLCAAQTRGDGRKAKSNSQVYIERNAARIRDNTRRVPHAITVQARLNGESVRVLLDSGSRADIISTTIVNQLNLPKTAPTKPLQLVLAISGLKGVVNYAAKGQLLYKNPICLGVLRSGTGFPPN
jgi:hypothetical protein